MSRLRSTLLLLAAICGVVLTAQTPLTPLMTLQGRTDSNGYLLVTAGGYTSPDSPLTALANLRGRTDANGYLLTTLAAGPALFGDGTSGAPSISFASEPTLGFRRNSATIVGLQGNLVSSGYLQIANTASIGTVSRGTLSWSADGAILFANNAFTIGNTLKTDALPTVASGFGTSPAVTAGSTPFSGSINVGTGGVATTGVINFNGTAFPTAAPFCLANPSLTNVPTRATTVSTTQLTLTTSTAWTASDVVGWICVGTK